VGFGSCKPIPAAAPMVGLAKSWWDVIENYDFLLVCSHFSLPNCDLVWEGPSLPARTSHSEDLFWESHPSLLRLKLLEN